MPKALLIEVEHEGQAPFVYELPPEYVIRTRDPKGYAKVKRRGFRVIPDFAGAAHAYCGETLEKCKGDLLEWDAKPTMDGMLRALIIKSRVRRTEDCLLVRPYSPALFRQGAAPGPQLLLERQSGKIKDEASLKAAWAKQTAKEEEIGRASCRERV